MTKIYSNQPLAPQRKQSQNLKQSKKGQSDFKSLLENKLKTNKLKFSKHAKQRLKSRNINLAQDDLHKLQEAVTKAKDKGAKESLVMAGENAYIVSVENDTVITAMDKNSMDSKVVTNIDSAVVME
ncbi:TIGR02530 family flagellar biosynthesis protein [Halanaerobacter jeridensis]|uniref:Flagellar operon protein n=1 Tax=Halanaerobacter jeridensis TaxID=706427 RepID=A0A938XPX7_9FIRM|nr:TIGR02530 family flagellar biosynthesis protein [Halanaerobacter jeridensis]MBM7555344.1 flagellar operon protein [Halanaerobacter jeridensis]